jgi:hypothetical protein
LESQHDAKILRNEKRNAMNPLTKTAARWRLPRRSLSIESAAACKMRPFFRYARNGFPKLRIFNRGMKVNRRVKTNKLAPFTPPTQNPQLAIEASTRFRNPEQSPFPRLLLVNLDDIIAVGI